MEDVIAKLVIFKIVTVPNLLFALYIVKGTIIPD